MGKFLEYLLQESSFSNVDFKKHNYLKDVIKYIVANKSILIGKSRVESVVDIKDVSEFEKFLSEKLPTISEFNAIANKFGFSWTKIFKGNFSGRTAGTDEEFKNVDAINKFIEENGKEYSLKIPVYNSDGKIVYAVYAKKQEGTPKADIAIYGFTSEDYKKNANVEEAKPVLWISHKKGSSAKDFSQYGGVSKHELENASSDAIKSVEIFVAGVKILFTDENGRRSSLYDVQSEELDESLYGYAVYGKDFGANEYGLNNVNFLLQGDISFKKRGSDAFEFGANFVEKNPEIPSGDRKPKLCTKTANDRITWKMHGVRMGIYPKIFHEKSAKDLLGELKKKFSISASSLEDFLGKYFSSKKIRDFYHTAKMLSLEDILKFELKP